MPAGRCGVEARVKARPIWYQCEEARCGEDTVERPQCGRWKYLCGDTERRNVADSQQGELLERLLVHIQDFA